LKFTLIPWFDLSFAGSFRFYCHQSGQIKS
jgi:hypothetical protein